MQREPHMQPVVASLENREAVADARPCVADHRPAARLGGDGEFILVREFAPDGTSSICATVPGEAASAPIKRLQAVLATSRDLPGEGFVRAVDLAHRDGRAVLVMEDPGGQLLSTLIGSPMEVEHAVGIALCMARALSHLHRRHLLNRDVRPERVLVDDERRMAWLIGLGGAASADRPVAVSDEITEAMAAYAAPERAGLVNVATDARSDLYSLGIVLFEMLAGRKPYPAADLPGVLHGHVAGSPARLEDIRPDIPPVVPAIVAKLIAKRPERRYQTAAGLAGDLSRVLAALRTGAVDPCFELGAEDFPAVLSTPAELHGRHAEVARLIESYRTVTATGAPGLVLVSAPSGMGKSSIVAEFGREIGPDRALLVKGKGDQFRRDVPFVALAQALAEMATFVLTRPSSEFALWRDRVVAAVGDDGELVAVLAPDFERILGRGLTAVDLPPRERRVRSSAVLRRLLTAFTASGSPLVLFIDDLHWLDVETMELLVDAVGDDATGRLLVIGAYRDGAWADAPAARMRVDALRAAGSRGTELPLEPLPIGAMLTLVAGALRQEPSELTELAALVHRRSGGNPFFALQFLATLVERRLLIAEPATRSWRWDRDEVLEQGITEDVVGLMVTRLERLPPPTRLVLSRLAALGVPTDAARLAAVARLGPLEVEAALSEAGRADLVRRRPDDTHAFAHDRIEEAAYALIPPFDRRHVHLAIGRLLSELDGAGDGSDVFNVTNQLNRALELVVEPDERLRIARLNLKAGHRARTASAFGAARAYFAAAVELFDEDGWSSDRRGAFEAGFHLAECEIYAQLKEEPATRLAALASYSVTCEEDAAVTCQRVALTSSLGRHSEAVELGLAFLSRSGIEWPRRPNRDFVQAEEDLVWSELSGRGPADLLALPLLVDAEQGAVMSVLAVMMVPAMFVEPELCVLVVARCIRLTFAHGNSDASPMAFAMAAIVMVSVTGRQDVGTALAEHAVDLVEDLGLRLHRAKVYVMAAHILHWTRSPRVLADIGAKAQLAAAETGDVLFGSYAAGQLVTAALAVGRPLGEVERLARRGLAQIGNDADVMVPQILAQLNVALALRGEALEYGIYGSQAGFDEAFDTDGNRHHIVVQWTSVRRLERAVFMGDAPGAVAAAERVEAVIRRDVAYFEWAECQFYGAVGRSMLLQDATEDRERHVAAVERHVALLSGWASNEPGTFAHRHALARAELARLRGRHWEAQLAFREAIDAAAANGFPHHEALAHERAAAFYAQQGFQESAMAHLAGARLGYLRWGATAKVAALDAVAPSLAVAELAAPVASLSERVDLATVLRVTAALTAEVSVDALVRRLLEIALEHAATERATLLSVDGEHAVVEAVASYGRSGAEVEIFRRGDRVPAIAQTIVRYVLRTGEILQLSGASAFGMFAGDPAFAGGAPESVLALPMIRHGAIAGMILLENRENAGEIGTARLSVLKLIAAEAAAALERARTREELKGALEEASRARRTAQTTIDAIPAMICVSSADGVVEFMSENWTQYSGFESEDMRGRGWVASVHPDDQQALIDFNVVHVASGEAGAIEARLRRHDGEYRWFRVDAKPMRDDAGRLIRWYGTLVDIHETRTAQATLRDLEAQLERVARVAAFGELTASIAHEVNQPLAAVLTNAETGLRWLSGSTPDIAEASGVLERIRGNAERMNEVILRLRRMFVRGEEEAREDIELNAAILETAAFVRPAFARDATALHTDLSGEPPRVSGNRVALQQVVLNLLTNAAQAVAGRERREVVVVSRIVADMVEVEVRDTGVGLSDVDPEGLFTSFRTTKPDGMGLGLSISRAIVESHGGRIWGTGAPDGGAAFVFTLPRT